MNEFINKLPKVNKDQTLDIAILWANGKRTEATALYNKLAYNGRDTIGALQALKKHFKDDRLPMIISVR